MNTKIIKLGDSTFVLETLKPVEWSLDGTVTLDVIGLDGTILTADNAVSTYAGDTVSVAAVAGEYTIELNSNNPLDAGDKIAIGSDAVGYQYLIVESYDSDNSSITLENCIDEDVPVGAEVIGLQMSSTVDVSTSEYTDIREVHIKWKSDNDLSMSELWRILNSYNQADGLVFDFQNAYPTLIDSVSDVEALYIRANQWMIEYFDTKNRDFVKIVDNQLTKEAVMLKMALMVGRSGDISEESYVRLKDEFDDSLKMLDNLKIWIDTNDDDIKTEDETTKASANITISRGM